MTPFYPVDGSSRFIQSIDTSLLKYTASQTSRTSSSSFSPAMRTLNLVRWLRIQFKRNCWRAEDGRSCFTESNCCLHRVSHGYQTWCHIHGQRDTQTTTILKLLLEREYTKQGGREGEREYMKLGDGGYQIMWNAEIYFWEYIHLIKFSGKAKAAYNLY
jgi:hypothetical protein